MRDLKYSILQFLLFTGIMVGFATLSFAGDPAIIHTNSVTGYTPFEVPLMASDLKNIDGTALEKPIMRWDIVSENGQGDDGQVYGTNTFWKFEENFLISS